MTEIHLRLEGPENVQLKQGRRDRGWSAHDTLKLYQSNQPGGDGGGHHADQQRPTKPPHEQHCRHDEPKQDTRTGGVFKLPRVTRVPGDATMTPAQLEPNHGDEQADPDGDGVL